MKRDMRIVFIGVAFLLMVWIAEAQEAGHELLWSYGGTDNYVESVSVSSDGSYIAVGSLNNNVYFFNIEGKLLWNYKTDDYVESVSVSSDGSYIVAGSVDNVYFFNREGKLLWSYKTGGYVYGVFVSSDGSYIACISRDENVYFFNREGKLLWSYKTGGFDGLSISSDGNYMAVGSGKVYFFNREGKLLWSYKTGRWHADSVSSDDSYSDSVSISSDGSYIAVGSRDNKSYFFNREGKLLWSYKTDGEVYSVSISSDGSYIAVGSRDNKAYFFNREGKLLWSYGTGGMVFSVSVSSDGSHIAVVSWDDKIHFFNREGNLLWSYKTGGIIERDSVSSDGSYIAVVSKDKKVYLFVSKNIAGSNAQTAILEARQAISQEKSKGFDVAEAEHLLSQAGQDVKTGNYSKAKSLTEQAKKLALDVDKDGVLNNEDFTPEINNYWIYSGTAIFLLGSIITLRANFKRRKKLREEKRRLEGMKQEILDKIEEVTKK